MTHVVWRRSLCKLKQLPKRPSAHSQHSPGWLFKASPASPWFDPVTLSLRRRWSSVSLGLTQAEDSAANAAKWTSKVVVVSCDTQTDVFKEKGSVTLLSFKSIDFASTTFLSALKLTQCTSLALLHQAHLDSNCTRVRWLADRTDGWSRGKDSNLNCILELTTYVTFLNTLRPLT